MRRAQGIIIIIGIGGGERLSGRALICRRGKSCAEMPSPRLEVAGRLT